MTVGNDVAIGGRGLDEAATTASAAVVGAVGGTAVAGGTGVAATAGSWLATSGGLTDDGASALGPMAGAIGRVGTGPALKVGTRGMPSVAVGATVGVPTSPTEASEGAPLDGAGGFAITRVGGAAETGAEAVTVGNSRRGGAAVGVGGRSGEGAQAVTTTSKASTKLRRVGTTRWLLETNPRHHSPEPRPK